MVEEKLTIAKTLCPRPMTADELADGQAEFLEVKKASGERVKLFRRGQSEGFINPRTVGTVQLDLSKPYQLRTFTPSLTTSTTEVLDGAVESHKAKKAIANFLVNLVGKTITYISETEKKVSVDVILEMLEGAGQGRMIEFSIPLEEYSSMSKFLRKTYPQCVVYNDEAFCELLAKKFGEIDEQMGDIISYRYNFGGWVSSPDGKLHFLDSSQPNVESDVLLKFDIEKAKGFLPIYRQLAEDKGKLAILLLFALWSGFAKFFEVCGLDLKGLRAALYISAPTGTGKTTLASIFTRALLKDPRKNSIRFEDTAANIEEQLLAGRDIPILIDDFYAQGTKVADAENERKASAVMRVAGDGQIRGKLGPDRKLRPDRLYRGSIICTGEYLALNTHSSILRCWQVFFCKGGISLGEEMGFLSSHIDITRSFLSEWIRYLEVNQDSIIKRLPEVLNRCEDLSRKALIGCKYARLETNLAALLTVASFFNDFCIQQLGIVPEQQLSNLLVEQAKDQLKSIEVLAPVTVWKKAMFDAVESGKLNIAVDENDFINTQTDGFFDPTGVLHCISGRLDKAVDSYAYDNRVGLKRTATLVKDLTDAGIIMLSPKGDCTYKYSKNRKNSPHRPRMYAICFKEDINNG